MLHKLLLFLAEAILGLIAVHGLLATLAALGDALQGDRA